MKQLIIGLCGEKQSGKTVFCTQIHNLASIDDKSTTLCSFSKPLKEILVKYFGLSNSQCFGDNTNKNTLTDWEWPICTGKEGYMNARQLMQYFGTDICRNYISEDVWVKIFLNRLAEIKSDIVLIDD